MLLWDKIVEKYHISHNSSIKIYYKIKWTRARLRFSKFMEKEDVDEAVNLIKIATQNAATDPVTGLINIDMIQTGISTSSKIYINKWINIIKTILRDFRENAEKSIKYNLLKDEAKKRIKDSGSKISDLKEFDFKEALRKLEDENIISLLGYKNLPNIKLFAKDFW